MIEKLLDWIPGPRTLLLDYTFEVTYDHNGTNAVCKLKFHQGDQKSCLLRTYSIFQAIDIVVMLNCLLSKTNSIFFLHQKILQHLPEKIYNRWQFHSIGMLLLFFIAHFFFVLKPCMIGAPPVSLTSVNTPWHQEMSPESCPLPP